MCNAVLSTGNGHGCEGVVWGVTGNGGTGVSELDVGECFFHNITFTTTRDAIIDCIPQSTVDPIDAIGVCWCVPLGAVRARLGRQGLKLGFGNVELHIFDSGFVMVRRIPGSFLVNPCIRVIFDARNMLAPFYKRQRVQTCF